MTPTEAESRGIEFQTQLQAFIRDVPESLKNDDLTLTIATWANNFDSNYTNDFSVEQISIYSVYPNLADEKLDIFFYTFKTRKYTKENLAIIYIYCAQITKIKSLTSGTLSIGELNEAAFIWAGLNLSTLLPIHYRNVYLESITNITARYTEYKISTAKKDLENIESSIRTAEDSLKNSAAEKIQAFNNAIENLDELYERVEVAKSQGTFNLLNSGFIRQMNAKKKSRIITLTLSLIIALAIIAVPAIKLYLSTTTPQTEHTQQATATSNDSAPSAAINFLINNSNTTIPLILTISIEIILIYYFRICMMHYNRISSELGQYDSRTAICEFIPYYIELMKTNKRDINAGLASFEEHVMSKIDPNPMSVPTTLECTIPIKTQGKD